MGDITRRDRGQLIVITALALAVLLSLLAVTLNTAVFAGFRAAQADDGPDAGRAAVQYRAAARRGVAGVIPPVNDGRVEYDALAAGLASEVEDWEALTRGPRAMEGVATSVALADVAFETRIVDDTSGEFTDQSGHDRWTLAGDVGDVRGYEATVTDDGEALVETADCTGASGCFGLAVEGEGGDTWRLYLHDAGADDRPDVAVRTANGTTQTCAGADGTTALNLTAGTADGCSFTSFRADPALDAPYTLTYANAANVSGTYNLTVEGRVVGGAIGATGVAGDPRYGTTGSPRLRPRVAAANVTVSYRSADLTYRTEIRVTPGGGDD